MNTPHTPVDSIRVLVADDSPTVQRAVKAQIDHEPSIELVGEAETADEALRKVRTLAPDILLLDIQLKEGNGLEVAERLKEEDSATKVLVVSSYDLDVYVDSLTRSGIRGYLMKQDLGSELIKAIRWIYLGEGMLSPTIAGRLLATLSGGPPPTGGSPRRLSQKELAVLELVMQGYANEFVATHLGYSEEEIQNTVEEMLSGLGAPSIQQAIHMAINSGYFSPN